MDDKKIYKILHMWFPELEKCKIPKKDQRHSFSDFLVWMRGNKEKDQHAHYMMTIHRHDYANNELEYSALLQSHATFINDTQQRINQRVSPIFAHFEQHKTMIGRYYNVDDQVFDIVFEEMMHLLRTQNLELLLIYAQDYHWIAVPKDAPKIEKFCRYFDRQFQHEQVSIEQYTLLNCARST